MPEDDLSPLISTEKPARRSGMISFILIAVLITTSACTRTSDNSVSMAVGLNGYVVPPPLFTVGETLNGYTPPGLLDGIGAYELDTHTIRVFANHELHMSQGYSYILKGRFEKTYRLLGARISFFDIDRHKREIKSSGVAYDYIYDADGRLADNAISLGKYFTGFNRFCSGQLSEAEQFGPGLGFRDRIYFAGEEIGGRRSRTGGAVWALDPASRSIWHLPALGRGAWENVTALDTGDEEQIALLLADDTAPFDSNNDGGLEAAPLYLYLGRKALEGDFPARNGLRDGQLYVWVPRSSARTPADFNTGGNLEGKWIAIDNRRRESAFRESDTAYDHYGFPTQHTLWSRAAAIGAFGFSRPEDVATHPEDGTIAVIASTGHGSFANSTDRVGTVYTIKTDFRTMHATLSILYDGDADPEQTLRSPDNLDWADDGMIYVQEDRAAAGLFGLGAANANEAGIIRINPDTGETLRVANINRNVVLDFSLATADEAIDTRAILAGAWESSGIVDVSHLFGEDGGSLFLFDVQAHGIRNQPSPSRINRSDLVEGGQLLFLIRTGERPESPEEKH